MEKEAVTGAPLREQPSAFIALDALHEISQFPPGYRFLLFLMNTSINAANTDRHG